VAARFTMSIDTQDGPGHYIFALDAITGSSHAGRTAGFSGLTMKGRASNAEKQPTGPGPEGCDENGPAAALLVGHVSV
jgi:hypothetical protein